MSDIHFVVSSLHEPCEVVVHVVEHHVNAALHVVDLVGCPDTVEESGPSY